MDTRTNRLTPPLLFSQLGLINRYRRLHTRQEQNNFIDSHNATLNTQMLLRYLGYTHDPQVRTKILNLIRRRIAANFDEFRQAHHEALSQLPYIPTPTAEDIFRLEQIEYDEYLETFSAIYSILTTPHLTDDGVKIRLLEMFQVRAERIKDSLLDYWRSNKAANQLAYRVAEHYFPEQSPMNVLYNGIAANWVNVDLAGEAGAEQLPRVPLFIIRTADNNLHSLEHVLTHAYARMTEATSAETTWLGADPRLRTQGSINHAVRYLCGVSPSFSKLYRYSTVKKNIFAFRFAQFRAVLADSQVTGERHQLEEDADVDALGTAHEFFSWWEALPHDVRTTIGALSTTNAFGETVSISQITRNFKRQQQLAALERRENLAPTVHSCLQNNGADLADILRETATQRAFYRQAQQLGDAQQEPPKTQRQLADLFHKAAAEFNTAANTHWQFSQTTPAPLTLNLPVENPEQTINPARDVAPDQSLETKEDEEDVPTTRAADEQVVMRLLSDEDEDDNLTQEELLALLAQPRLTDADADYYEPGLAHTRARQGEEEQEVIPAPLDTRPAEQAPPPIAVAPEIALGFTHRIFTRFFSCFARQRRQCTAIPQEGQAVEPLDRDRHFALTQLAACSREITNQAQADGRIQLTHDTPWRRTIPMSDPLEEYLSRHPNGNTEQHRVLMQYATLFQEAAQRRATHPATTPTP